MKQYKLRVYFDFNIFEYIYKNKIKLDTICSDGIDYYLSVAHAEEYYKMKKCDINGENKEEISKKKQLMMEISSGGILNPSSTRIVNKNESFNAALERVEEYDTTEFVINQGNTGYEQFTECSNKIKSENVDAINYSNLSYSEVWETDPLQSIADDFECHKRKYNPILIRQTIDNYGIEALNRKLFPPISITLNPNCFENIKKQICIFRMYHRIFIL